MYLNDEQLNQLYNLLWNFEKKVINSRLGRHKKTKTATLNSHKLLFKLKHLKGKKRKTTNGW